MIKKALCLILSVQMLFASVSVGVSAEDGATTTVALADAAYIRHSSSMSNKVCGGETIVVDNKDGSTTSSQRRMGFLKFDFSEYADDIDSISEVKLSLAAIDAKAASEPNFTLAILPDDKEGWSSETLTFNIANNELDMARSDCGEVIYSGIMENGKYTESDNISEAVVAHLKENTSNTIVTFKVDATIALAYQIHGKGSAFEPYISVKQAIDIDKVLENEYEALTFERINSSPIENVVTDFEFVREGSYGTVIEWSSSDENVINSITGAVTRPKKGEGGKKVILTATILNGEKSLQKEFEVYVPEGDLLPIEMLRTQIVYAYSTSYIRSGSKANEVYENQNIVVDKTTSGSSHRIGFIRFDFSGYEDILEETQRITMKLDTYTDAKAENGSNFVVYVLPDAMEEGLDSSTLTYTEAQKRGLVAYTDNLVYVSPSGLKPSTTYETDDFCSKIKENLSENPDNKIVWIKVASTEGAAYSINGGNANDAIKPKLLLGYPKIPIELDTISLKIPSAVKTDLTLPLIGEYGSKIEWSSSNENVISANGKVNAGTADEDFSKEDTVVKLTAVLTDDGETREKVFEVRAVREGVMDAVKDTYANEQGNYADDTSIIFGGSTGNFALIDFEISEYMQRSRKTVLKVYADDENAGEDIEVACITDSQLKKNDIDDISYEQINQIASSETKYIKKGKINSDGYALIDVTEYIMKIEDSKALFSLKTSGPRVVLCSTEGDTRYLPKLISSPVEYSDEYAVGKVADELIFEDISDEPADNVRKALKLFYEGEFGAKIIWKSSDDKAIDVSDGSIHRGEVNKNVSLTATIKIGEATAEKTFNIVIIKEETDTEYAQYLASTLKPENALLTSSIVLPGAELPDGAGVVWKTENKNAKIDGYTLNIERPYDKDLVVTLTATVTYNGSSASQDYNVVIIRAAEKNILRNRNIVQGDTAAKNAVDENIDTVWHVNNKEVIYDMGSNKVVSALTIIPRINSFSGVVLSVSKDNMTWENIYSGGEFIQDSLNYINLNTAGYGRYLKLELPSLATDICFLAAYSSNEIQNNDIFSNISIPARATTSFELESEIDGNKIEWVSSSTLIRIDSNRAIVNQSSQGTNVTLTAKITVNGNIYEKSYVVYVPASGSSGGSGGGGGSASGGTGAIHSIAASNTNSNANELKNKFDDISNHAWAVKYINSLAEKGIIDGKENRKFYPQDNIKREEMAKILVLAFGLNGNSYNEDFSDVLAGSWYEEYVYSLVSSGGASGIGNGLFGIGQNITRQDAFKMIASVLKTNTTQYDMAQFNDSDAIADYASESVNALYAMGIISGDDSGCINPNSYITRAEAAKVVCLAMEQADN